MSKKSIIITGASSGLGKAIALEYAKSFDCILFLLGQSAQRLAAVAEECRQHVERVYTYAVAIEEKEKLAAIIQEIAKIRAIDILVACAGVSEGSLRSQMGHRDTAGYADKILHINLYGTVNTVMPVVQHMTQNRRGNIVVISSMAGLLGLASSPSYSASKGAIKLFAEALAPSVRKYGVKITIAIPGFIKTPMTDVNNFYMPFLTTPEKAVKKIILATARGKLVVAFPIVMYLLVKFLNILPAGVFFWLNSKLPSRYELPSENSKLSDTMH